MSFAIMWNNTACKDACGVCGCWIDPPIGLHVFGGGTGIVCDGCARKHAPELYSLLRLYDAAQVVARVSGFGQINDDREVARILADDCNCRCGGCGGAGPNLPVDRMTAALQDILSDSTRQVAP